MSSPRERGLLPVAASLVVLTLVGISIDGLESLAPAARSFQRDYAPRRAFPGNKTIRLFTRLGVLHPQPIGRADAVTRRGMTPRGRKARAVAFYGTDPVRARALPSSRKLPRKVRRLGLPTLSLSVGSGDLRNLRRHPFGRGRATEKSAFVSYFDEAKLRFAAAAGMRMHGGRSRIASHFKSFRLYFRDVYGQDRVPSSVFFGTGTDSLRRLVVHNDVRHDVDGEEWHFTNPLAYDIARQVGAEAPRTKPVLLYLNGDRQSVYVLTERLDDDYLRERFGHDRFAMVRTKMEPRSPLPSPSSIEKYEAFSKWTRSSALSLPEAFQRVDVDNLSRWFLSMLICGTTDAFQGPALLDESRPYGKWFWLNWDMDHSFMRAHRRSSLEPWRDDTYQELLFEAGAEPRNVILRKLFRLPAFREFFLDLLSETLNHRVTPAFLEERFDHYSRLALQFEIEKTTYLRPLGLFLKLRPDALRDTIGEHLGTGESVRVTVRVPSSDEPGLEVDGYSKSADYTGWYFPGQVITIVAPGSGAFRVSGWRVDGQTLPSGDGRLELRVDGPRTIEPILAG